MDVLTDILDSVELSGDIFFRCAFKGPWGMQIEQTPVAEFHLIVNGNCWVRITEQDEPVLLDEGDIVLFPHGHAHVLLDAPATRPVAASDMVPEIPEDYGVVEHDGDGAIVGILCGYFKLARQGHSALLNALPPFIHIRGDDIRAEFPWLLTVMRCIDHETRHVRPGSTSIVKRLVEILFVQILRCYVVTTPQAAGLPGAVAHRRIGRALERMHAEPGYPWTLEQLARHAGMSRSAFASDFRMRVGQTPMQYLGEWRMHRARALLESSRKSMGEIAEQCGYQSESSFSKAFKRQFGSAPGACRKKSG